MYNPKDNFKNMQKLQRVRNFDPNLAPGGEPRRTKFSPELIL